jgi:hypothetical protein
MTSNDHALLALDRAADALNEAATDLALAVALARETRLAGEASVLAVAVEAELAAVVALALRHG